MNKKKIRWALAVAALLLAAFITYPLARNSWLLQRAQNSFAAGEDRKASLQALRLIQIDPHYIPAALLLAELAEKHHSREALRWRNYAAQKEPTTANQIAFAKTCIFFREWNWADEALRSVKAADRGSPLYLQTAGSLALGLNRYEDAAYFFARAAAAGPDSPELQLNLAITRLTLADAGEKEKARKVLQELQKSPAPALAQAATKALLQDALANRQAPGELVTRMLSYPSGFPEYLLALTALTQAKDPGTDALLQKLQKEETNHAGEIYALANWMVRQNRAAEAKSWLDSLPEEKRRESPVPMAYAECLTALKDWPALENRLAAEKWDDAELLRNAFLWRARREAKPWAQSETGLSQWQEALRGKGVRPGELYLVAQLFWSWGWQIEAENLWWTLAEQTPNPEMALRSLDQIYRARKNTRNLWRVSQIAQKSNPRDKVAKNNYAMLSLLLNADSQNAHRLAEELYRGQPDNAAFLSTYAFSLYRRNQNAEALRLYSTLKPEILNIPEFAFYYALFLRQAGRTAEALPYAKLAEKASLLPEEKALLPQSP